MVPRNRSAYVDDARSGAMECTPQVALEIVHGKSAHNLEA